MHSSENVDHAELAKFSKMAEDWWNPFGNCKPLHDINPLRLSFIEKYAPVKGKRILDIGCGGGILSEALARAGGHVTAIDLSHEALAIAMTHAQAEELSIDYRECAVEELVETQNNTYDIITCMELLEHVPEPAAIIQASAKLLKPNGHAFFSTINRKLKAYLYAVIGAEYLLKLLPKGTHDYRKFLTPVEMFEMLQAEGFQLSHTAGLEYHPIFKTYRLTTDVSVNYLLHCYKDAPT